ncbi:MAG: helix-turn-helix transcriptional regulator [Nitrospinae bacterium]|nr:helix-turn-helix transcriptional regulator [Nitrospinota bacterium]
MDSANKIYAIKLGKRDNTALSDEHPTDGEVTFVSSDDNIRSRIHIIARRTPDAMVMYSKIEVNRPEPFPLNVTRPTGSEALGVRIPFSGTAEMHFSDGFSYVFKDGLCSLIATHGRGALEWVIHPNQVYETVNITYSREERLETFKDVTLPPELAELTKEHIETRFVWDMPMSPLFMRIAKEIIASPYRGAAKQFFLESKALELLSGLAVILDQSAPREKHVITTTDRQRLNDTRDILLARYDDPPSLLELAAAAGMNHKTLNNKFRREFGVTMHEFLYDYRLEQGQRMLKAGRSVKETASALGYRHSSAFINTYRKKFGVSPGAHGKSTA